jgi:hypothetical protein
VPRQRTPQDAAALAFASAPAPRKSLVSIRECLARRLLPPHGMSSNIAFRYATTLELTDAYRELMNTQV